MAILLQFLIHWRGEKDPGYSKPFRQLEFESALAAELGLLSIPVRFVNALNYTGDEAMIDMNIDHFNEAMQFVSFGDDSITVSMDDIIRTVQRCSLVSGLYEIVASSDSLDDLAPRAIENGGFSDLLKGAANEKATWCFRARSYGARPYNADDKVQDAKSSKKGRTKRYSSRTRSMQIEKDGLKALTSLLIQFGGKVDLVNPDYKIYIFDGLEDETSDDDCSKILARRIASGPQSYSIAPTERICITNTPLEPIAAFVLCNIARIKNYDKVLDMYAGSCATLLAAAMIAPDCESVGVEIAHNGYVNRTNIILDFISRSLKEPKELILGDSTDLVVREAAKAAVNNESFDIIIADPPYGIRESVGYNENSPLEEMFAAIAFDRSDKRLLKLGGRLVAFVPVTDEQVFTEMLPSQELTEKAGLKFEDSREQPLNTKLSRWLVSYVSVS
ncbi:hypothetical protein FRACYDRAFT_226162 [Fragilariopsis cylindrus CCMP1102]|uniref:Ribosomal RNA large subunit methyltransferase K/L-like methyltransferase domain-containing protein n=1 Tax=Fragilariopsis cylindrus CCMP1102 TaxID=635003 RepID=A0A1E7FB89_9STRA|nr:hypothetical protein FRACYDRAFT_226162 [Fragilariopsis cylindrus CCMP1102]|eukprot:OEU15442.1 hypothetical protein FRACYDRAFT_226162 [Fragilariopsis cylindrus CCMP1102]